MIKYAIFMSLWLLLAGIITIGAVEVFGRQMVLYFVCPAMFGCVLNQLAGLIQSKAGPIKRLIEVAVSVVFMTLWINSIFVIQEFELLGHMVEKAPKPIESMTLFAIIIIVAVIFAFILFGIMGYVARKSGKTICEL